MAFHPQEQCITSPSKIGDNCKSLWLEYIYSYEGYTTCERPVSNKSQCEGQIYILLLLMNKFVGYTIQWFDHT